MLVYGWTLFRKVCKQVLSLFTSFWSPRRIVKINPFGLRVQARPAGQDNQASQLGIS